ncbi:hypothetical protein [Sphingomonas oryzagri]
MSTSDIDYRNTAAKRYVSYLAELEQPNGAGILIACNALDVEEHEREIARRLADLGYVTLLRTITTSAK